MTEVRITSFGYGHQGGDGQPLPAPAAHITADLRAHFRDPSAAAHLRELTGADPAVRAAVLATPGIPGLIRALAAAARDFCQGTAEPLSIAIGCAGGRHRSAVVAGELAAALSGTGARVDLIHRDIGRPVLPASRPGRGPAPATAVHDSPHYANGPRLGAPDPVSAVCVCHCANCCGHREGTAAAAGQAGRCPGCSCYLTPSGPPAHQEGGTAPSP
jgi:UPF0042 nucleotide-binding protein